MTEDSNSPADSDDSGNQSEPSDQSVEARLARVLDDYLSQRRQGSVPAREQIKQQNPDLADQLDSYLDGIDLLSQHRPLDFGRRDELGDFVLGEEIGRGGMGVVYKAHQRSLDRAVALKILNLPLSDKRVRERFQREAAMAAGLHHTNIVPIYEVGDDKGTYFYAMQYIEGDSLAEVMRDEENPLDLERVARWGLQSAEALSHAHSQGVVHRDIKPSNLIVDRQDQIWLTDFGLARRMDDVRLSATGAVLGTPRYMSPEQASTIDAPVAEQTDIYSLGATLYELACGNAAVQGDHPVAVINNIMNESCRSPREFRAEVSRDLETILLRCLEKEPSNRYPDAQSLANDLRALTENRPINSRPVSALEKSRRWLKQNRRGMRWAGVGCAAALMLICAGLWTAWTLPTLDDAEIQLHSLSDPMRADLTRIDGESDSIVVSVPTTDRVVLDAGIWDSRLSRPGVFSHDVRHWIGVGEDKSLMLPSPPGPVWTIDDVINTKVVRFSDGDGIILVRTDTIERRDASTGELVWSVDKKSQETEQPKGGEFTPGYGKHPEAPPGLFQPVPICVIGDETTTSDINGDGEADLLFPASNANAVLAISGSDGSVLWKKAYSMKNGFEIPDKGSCAWIHSGTGLEQTQSNPIVTFSSPYNQGSLTAELKLKDGAVLWEQRRPSTYAPFDVAGRRQEYCKLPVPMFYHDTGNPHPSYTYVPSLSSHFNTNSEFVPLLLPLDTKRLISSTRESVLSINRENGVATKIVDLHDHYPVQHPRIFRYADDKDGVLIATQIEPLDDWSEKERILLQVLDRDLKNVKWKRTIRADPTSRINRWTGAPKLPHVVDLDHDGIDEIVAQVDRTSMESTMTTKLAWAELQVIGSSGKDKLKQPIRVQTSDFQVLHLQVVDDQDGDGWDDLAIATRYLSMRDRAGKVHVEVRSSQTGKLLWHRPLSRSSTARNSPPHIYRFDRHRIAGQEILAVATASSANFNAPILLDTHLLDAVTGKVLHLGEQLTLESTVKDGNGDAMLWCCDRAISRPAPTQENLGRRFAMFRFPNQRTLHIAHPFLIVDMDGDHALDVRNDTETFVSTASNREISVPCEENSTLSTRCDVSGNGHVDYVTWKRNDVLQLMEGVSGRKLWEIDRKIMISESVVAVIPLIGKPGETDLLVAARAEIGNVEISTAWKKPMVLFRIGGATGNVKWLCELPSNGSSAEYTRLHYAVGDINGDQTSDFVCSYYGRSDKASVFAFDGATGDQLWEMPNVYSGSPDWLGHFPKPCIIASDGRSFVATISTSTHGYDLMIADGRKGRLIHKEKLKSRNAYPIGNDRQLDRKSPGIIVLRRSGSRDNWFAFAYTTMDDKNEVCVYSHDAGEIRRAVKSWSFTNSSASLITMTPALVDEDKNDDIIINTSTKIAAMTVEGAKIWEYEFDGTGCCFQGLRTVGDTQEYITKVFKGDTIGLVGLDVKTGSVRWTVRGLPRWRPAGNRYQPDGMVDNKSPLPTFVFYNENQPQWTTITAKATRGNDIAVQGSLVASVAPPRPVVDRRAMGGGPYPFSLAYYLDLRGRDAAFYFWPPVWCLFCYCIPAMTLMHLIRKRKFSLSSMLAVMVAAAACFAVLTIPIGTSSLFASERLGQGLRLVPGAIWMFLIYSFCRKELRQLMWLTLTIPLMWILVYEAYKSICVDTERIQVFSDIMRLWLGLPGGILLACVLMVPVWVSTLMRTGSSQQNRQHAAVAAAAAGLWMVGMSFLGNGLSMLIVLVAGGAFIVFRLLKRPSLAGGATHE